MHDSSDSPIYVQKVSKEFKLNEPDQPTNTSTPPKQPRRTQPLTNAGITDRIDQCEKNVEALSNQTASVVQMIKTNLDVMGKMDDNISRSISKIGELYDAFNSHIVYHNETFKQFIIFTTILVIIFVVLCSLSYVSTEELKSSHARILTLEQEVKQLDQQIKALRGISSTTYSILASETNLLPSFPQSTPISTATNNIILPLPSSTTPIEEPHVF